MVTAILIGAGQRGYEVYGRAAKGNPDKLRFIAVAEPDRARRERFAEEHGIPTNLRFETWEPLLEMPKMADAAFICTGDRSHTEPTLKALEDGYHVLLEKPMATSAAECVKMGHYGEKYGRVFNICHVLRYSEFFSAIKRIVDSGEIGQIVNIKHAENVGYWHQAHSFVRGNWRNSDESSPMILQKCCHDMDILRWLIGRPCVSVCSMGELTYFRSDNAPEGAPMRCSDGCPAEASCPFSALRFYLGENTGWPVSVISTDMSLEGRRKAIESGPYGRCVFHCDNNVVDHQVTALEFEGGVTATLTMCAFTPDTSRSIEIMGTRGYIKADMSKIGEDSKENRIYINDFLSGRTRTVTVNDHGLMNGHEGADVLLTLGFVDLVEKGDTEGLTSVKQSVESHLMSLAAERSRIEHRIVSMDEMWNS